MGQLKEVRTAAETMEKGRESLLSIGRVEGRPSGLLEPNKCGRKKSVRTESVSRFRSCNNSSLRDVLGSTGARGEREKRGFGGIRSRKGGGRLLEEFRLFSMT